MASPQLADLKLRSLSPLAWRWEGTLWRCGSYAIRPPVTAEGSYVVTHEPRHPPPQAESAATIEEAAAIVERWERNGI